MNWSMIDYIPIEICQVTFTKTISAYFGNVYAEMQTKSPKAVTEFAKNLVSDDMSQKLFQYVFSKFLFIIIYSLIFPHNLIYY